MLVNHYNIPRARPSQQQRNAAKSGQREYRTPFTGRGEREHDCDHESSFLDKPVTSIPIYDSIKLFTLPALLHLEFQYILWLDGDYETIIIFQCQWPNQYFCLCNIADRRSKSDRIYLDNTVYLFLD